MHPSSRRSTYSVRTDSGSTGTLTRGCSYYASENDLNVVARGVRFLLRLARTEPLASLLDLKAHATDTGDFFWPGDADPDQVRSLSCPLNVER